jgi:hypothetical protein
VDDDGDGRIDEADENEIDTLVENLTPRTETFSADVGLYNDKLVIGNLLNSAGPLVSRPARMPANELIDAGDRFAGDAIVEDSERTCSRWLGSPVRRWQQHLRRQRPRSHDPGRRQDNFRRDWRGTAYLDNAANDGPLSRALSHHGAGREFFRREHPSTGTDGSDRLVLTGTDAGDRYLLTADGVTDPSRRCTFRCGRAPARHLANGG